MKLSVAVADSDEVTLELSDSDAVPLDDEDNEADSDGSFSLAVGLAETIEFDCDGEKDAVPVHDAVTEGVCDADSDGLVEADGDELPEALEESESVEDDVCEGVRDRLLERDWDGVHVGVSPEVTVCVGVELTVFCCDAVPDLLPL